MIDATEIKPMTSDSRRNRSFKASKKDKILALLVVFGLPVIAGLMYSGHYLIFVKPNFPPGFKDIWPSRQWDRENISHFLNIPIPDDAKILAIEGHLGLVGQYGIYPTLSFSFSAPPESAEGFINQFCDGVLYPGYNPARSIDSNIPVGDSVLVRGKGTIHYSRSPNIPNTILGNRCARYDDREKAISVWLEEIWLDTSDPDQYIVHYNLPYEENSSNAEELYPRAFMIKLSDKQFRIHITGFNFDNELSSFVLEYPIVCLETAQLALEFFMPEGMSSFVGATVEITIDDAVQSSAQISPSLYLWLLDSEYPRDKWQYCLDAAWEPGIHIMQITVAPVDGDVLNLDWEFTVPPGAGESSG